MAKRDWNDSQMSGRNPLPHAIRMQCSRSRGFGGELTRNRQSSPIYWNRVHSVRVMSSQKPRAENFLRRTTDPQRTSIDPIGTTPPTLWYMGRQSYIGAG